MQYLKKWWAILGVIASSLFMVATIDSKQIIDNYDLAKEWVMSSPVLEGSWSTSYPGEDFEGLSENKWLESPKQTVVEISVDGNDISGIISTPQIREFIDNTPQMVDYFLLEGHRQFFRRTFEARVYEYIGGKKYVFAILNFTLEDGRLLMADFSPGMSKFVPQEAILIKRSDTSFDQRLHLHLDDYSEEKAKKILPMLKRLQEENKKNEKGRAN